MSELLRFNQIFYVATVRHLTFGREWILTAELCFDLPNLVQIAYQSAASDMTFETDGVLPFPVAILFTTPPTAPGLDWTRSSSLLKVDDLPTASVTRNASARPISPRLNNPPLSHCGLTMQWRH